MRARSSTAVHLAALAAGAFLGACGGGLYDAKGVPQIAGGGDTCGTDQVACLVNGVRQCTVTSADACGAACEVCTTTVTHGIAACLGKGASSACGYECADASGTPEGFLKCKDGCCTTTALAAGEKTTCALVSSGEVACWGTGYGPAPQIVPLSGTATAIAVGTSHACALSGDGSVRCWGSNASGQLGGTPTGGFAVPVASLATAIGAGANHTCAIVGAAVRCWGANGSGEVTGTIGADVGAPTATPVGSGAATISAGAAHTCALLVSGAVQCWGDSGSGQLGGTPSGGVATPLGAAITVVSANANQTCAGTPSNGGSLDDALRCWGDSVGADWLLGSPQLTPAIPLQKVDQATIRHSFALLAAGGHHVCVSGELPGVVECLGLNDRDQLGGAAAPGEKSTVNLPAGAAALTAGASHTCAAVSDGRIRCWGANDVGQLGNGASGPDADPGLGVLATPLGR